MVHLYRFFGCINTQEVWKETEDWQHIDKYKNNVNEYALQEMSFLAATNVAGKNAKLLQKVFFAAKKLLLHVAGISAVAKSFARTINVAAITGVLQQQLMSLAKLVFLATINVAGITSDFLQQQLLSLS
ncbi:hypothetical protein QL285_039683 [Trifolium repens]|nr:hypothetical protein QL285_039683 [Trifolium repens]